MIGHRLDTRELWASSLREVKKRIRPLFAQERAALNAACSWTGCLATSVVKPDGCARRQRAILGLGGSRRFWEPVVRIAGEARKSGRHPGEKVKNNPCKVGQRAMCR